MANSNFVLGDREKNVLRLIEKYPNGISYNELCRQAEKSCSRQTVSNSLKRFAELGLVEKKKVGKQRVSYQSTELHERLSRRLSGQCRPA